MFRISACRLQAAMILSAVLLAPAQCLPAFGSSETLAPKPGEPTDPKARKTYADAFNWEKVGMKGAAIDAFRKANKQDGGHCFKCLSNAYELALSIGQYKEAEEIAREWLPSAQTDDVKAGIHYRIAVALQQRGISDKKDKCFDESCDEFKSALSLVPQYAAAHYGYGLSLAYLHQDEAARSEFSTFLNQDKQDLSMHERAQRFVDRVELARARMVPAFSITTLDGRHVTMDSLAGKVVLIDFWATWCGPCREALPHIRQIAKKFEGQPFVVLSVSLDKDEAKWKDFVGKNQMTWLQYRDGSFDGNLATLFAIHAIPATFTIDADGVLEDQHVGDADIEGKLKKLIAHANEMAKTKTEAATAAKSATAPN
jgi:thiol-disulfide isomerase/thioredoxin